MLCHLSHNFPLINLCFYTLSKYDVQKIQTKILDYETYYIEFDNICFQPWLQVTFETLPFDVLIQSWTLLCNSFWLRQFCTMRNWNMVWHVDPKRPSYCLWPQSSVNSNKLPFKLIYSFEFNHKISKTVFLYHHGCIN